MPDYRDGGTSETPPWYPHVNRISSLTIGEGVTRIGDYAFMLCSFVTKVVIPESVTSMGDWAFWHWNDLRLGRKPTVFPWPDTKIAGLKRSDKTFGTFIYNSRII